MSHGSSHRTTRYSIDLLSPVDIGLLRHAEVMHDEAGEDETVVADWVFGELPS
ncbi:MAG: hypothetical protein JWO68_3298 [Actinomycetia bacterium]|nr:hypothetical protein [Actinomycetes bacterium]